VTVRSRKWLAAALGLSLISPGSGWAAGQAPSRGLPAAAAPTANQQTADAIAERLRQSPVLKNFTVTVSYARGVAEVNGEVVSMAQRDEALRIIGEFPIVRNVVDNLVVVIPAQAATASQIPPAGLLPVQASAPSALPLPPAPNVPPPTPMPAPGAPAAGGFAPEAVPSFQAPAPAPYDLNPPKMPPYAWPNYAPYNNYSRVAYPTAYPYNAFPFIGPIYPFPKVPLGWRAVKLEWDDGYWWYSKLMTKYDWWRLRFY
jgi:hypothetical protein